MDKNFRLGRFRFYIFHDFQNIFDNNVVGNILGNIVDPDFDEEFWRLADNHVIQTIQHAKSIVSRNSAIDDGRIIQQFLPIAKFGDAIAKKNRFAFDNRLGLKKS